MTAELRTLITAKEIVGVDFGCTCGTKTLIPLDKLDEINQRCPNCRRPWWRDSTELQEFAEVVRLLKEVQRRTSENMTIRFHLREPLPSRT